MKRFLTLLFIGTLVAFSPLFATLQVTDGTTLGDNATNIIPQGQFGSVLSVELQGATDGDFLRTLTLEVRGVLRFGAGIREVSIYADSNDDQEFNINSNDSSGDTKIGSRSFSSLGASVQEISVGTELVASPTRYFVVFELDETQAGIGTTGNISLRTINAGLSSEISSFTGFNVTNTVRVSGFSLVQATDVAPDTVIPGQSRSEGSFPVTMLKLAVKASGEDVSSKIGIKIVNDYANFVTNNALSNGVTKVYLYDNGNGTSAPPDSPEQFNPAKIVAELDASDFLSPSEALFYFPTASTGPSGKGLIFDKDTTTSNFLIMYDIGEDFIISNDTRISAEIAAVTGNGSESNLPVVFNTTLPNEGPAESKVAGVTYASLTSIVPNDIFGDESIVPILKFSLRAIHSTFNITSLTIGNPDVNGVPFATDNSPEGIQRIQVYEDLGPNNLANGTFDGVNGIDRLVGDLVLGSGQGGINESDLATLDIEYSENNTTKNVEVRPYNSNQVYPINKEKRFFVVYYMGTNIAANKTASARIQNATARLVLEGVTHNISLSGKLPAAATPNAQVRFSDTNVYLLSVTDISPVTVIQGQLKVPMLRMQLHSDGTIASASMTIENNQKSFTSQSAGVTKAWLYRDDEPFQDTFDPRSNQNPDVTLITATKPTNTDSLKLIGIPLTEGDDNHFFLLYDIGALSTTGMSAQLTAMESEEELIFGGELPTPRTAASVSPNVKQMLITDVTTDKTVINDSTGTFNVTVVVKNRHSQDLSVVEVAPRIYLTSIGGQDISFEFKSILEEGQSLPFTIAAGEAETFRFDVKHKNRVSEGAAVLDGYLKYSVDAANQAQVSRYQNSNRFFSAAANQNTNDSTAKSMSLQNPEVKLPTDLPSYIASIRNVDGAISEAFSNQNAIPAGSSLVFQFANSGQGVDESSLQVQLNGSALTRQRSVGGASVQATSTSFTYVSETDVSGELVPVGQLTISDVGNSSGTVLIDATDPDGNALPQATIDFIIESNVKISDALFYPNPFQIGSRSLLLGFNLTRPAKVTGYVYNHNGARVHRFEETFLTAGYKRIEFDSLASFLSSGHFIVRLVAEADGQKSHTTAKLGVY